MSCRCLVLLVSADEKPLGRVLEASCTCGAAACYSPTPCQCSTIAVPGLASGFEWDRASPPGPWPRKSSLVRSDAGVCRPVATWEPDSGRGYVDVRLVARQCSLPSLSFAGEMPLTPPGDWNVSVAFRPLVPGGSTPRGASTSGYRPRVLHGDYRKTRRFHGMLILEQASR